MDDGLFDETLADKAIRFQNGLIATATSGSFDGGDPAYKEMRALFASRADTKSKLPDFIRRCSDLGSFGAGSNTRSPAMPNGGPLFGTPFGR